MGNGQSTVDTSETISSSLSTFSKDEITSGQLGQQWCFLRFALGVSELVAMTGHGENYSFFLPKKRKGGKEGTIV